MIADRMTEPVLRDRACQVSANWDGGPPWCWEPSAVLVMLSCACEPGHDEKRNACLPHLRDLERGEWTCGPCAEDPDPHECPQRLHLMWHGEASSCG